MALIRELIGDPLFYLFGRRYGDVGIRWIEHRLRTRRVLAGHGRALVPSPAAYVVVAVWPINIVCLLAGATKMRPLAFFSLNITGTIVRIGLIFWLGDLLEDPLRDIAVVYCAGTSGTSLRSRSCSSWCRCGVRVVAVRSPVETVGELQAELADAELELEDEATIRDEPPDSIRWVARWNRRAPTST